MKFLKQYLFLAILIVSVAALLYGNVYIHKVESPSGSALIPEEEYNQILIRAKNNELESIRLIISHLEAKGDMTEARNWRRRALALGDHFELKRSSQVLFDQSQSPSLSAPERESLLAQSLAAAERVPKSDRSVSEDKFIQEIKGKMNQHRDATPHVPQFNIPRKQ